MSTLFQLHADINSLKAVTHDMATLWHVGDSILLLGDTAAYLDWFNAYVDDLNADEELELEIEGIESIYALSSDVNTLNDSAKININLTSAIILTDENWAKLTQKMNRVVTLGITN